MGCAKILASPFIGNPTHEAKATKLFSWLKHNLVLSKYKATPTANPNPYTSAPF